MEEGGRGVVDVLLCDVGCDEEMMNGIYVALGCYVAMFWNPEAGIEDAGHEMITRSNEEDCMSTIMVTRSRSKGRRI